MFIIEEIHVTFVVNKSTGMWVALESLIKEHSKHWTCTWHMNNFLPLVLSFIKSWIQMNSQGNKYVMCWIFIQFRVIFLEHNPIQLVIFYWIVPTELHLIGLQTTSLNDE